jgi:ABC-type nickel/cobalt efflux system permease component RcnA
MDRSIQKRSLSGSGEKLVRALAFTLLLLTLIWEVIPAKAQNPFTSKDDQQHVSHAPSLPHPFLTRIAAWQQQLNQKMAALTREAKETGTIRPLLTLIIIAFAYGVLHAAGPGHGKAVVVSYILSRGKNLGLCILLGNLTALFHALSGVGLVLAVHFVLQKGVTGSLGSVTHTTQLISYGLIMLLGAALLVRSLVSCRGHERNERSSRIVRLKDRLSHPFWLAIAVGMIPCPGVVLVMLFFISLDFIGLGLLLVFFLTLGMAVTISAVGVAGLFGKNLVLGALERRHTMAKNIERGIETTAAFIVTVLGLLFFAAAL